MMRPHRLAEFLYAIHPVIKLERVNIHIVCLLESPTAVIRSSSSYLEGTKVQVYCTAEGCPTPTLTWTKQGSVSSISTSSSGFVILEFASIAIENGGVYQCTVENGAVGSPVSKTVDIKVFRKWAIDQSCLYTYRWGPISFLEKKHCTNFDWFFDALSLIIWTTILF